MLATGGPMKKADTQLSHAEMKKVTRKTNFNSESTATKTLSSAKKTKFKVVLRKCKTKSLLSTSIKHPSIKLLNFWKKMILIEIYSNLQTFFFVFRLI